MVYREHWPPGGEVSMNNFISLWLHNLETRHSCCPLPIRLPFCIVGTKSLRQKCIVRIVWPFATEIEGRLFFSKGGIYKHFNMIHNKPVNRKIKLLKDVVHALGFKDKETDTGTKWHSDGTGVSLKTLQCKHPTKKRRRCLRTSAVTDCTLCTVSKRCLHCKHLNMKRAPVTRQPPRSPPPSDLQRSAGCTTSHFGLRRVIALQSALCTVHTTHCTVHTLYTVQTANCAPRIAKCTVHTLCMYSAFFCCRVHTSR